MAESYNFRTAFNGFHREDVVHYLQYLQNKHNGQLNQLRSDIASAEKELGDLRSLQDVLADLRTQYTELENERDAALERIRELEQELIAERSKKPAAPVSDENELEAYRRAERAERQAQQRAEQLMAQAHGIVAEVSAHADENAQQIGQMAEQVAAQLSALQQVVMSSKATFMDAAVAMCAIRPQE